LSLRDEGELLPGERGRRRRGGKKEHPSPSLSLEEEGR